MNIKVDMVQGYEDNDGNAEAGIEMTDLDLQKRANQNCSLENEGRLFDIGESKEEGVIY